LPRCDIGNSQQDQTGHKDKRIHERNLAHLQGHDETRPRDTRLEARAREGEEGCRGVAGSGTDLEPEGAREGVPSCTPWHPAAAAAVVGPKRGTRRPEASRFFGCGCARGR
jgi:hypothetical protein